jgi:hypothetical protein
MYHLDVSEYSTISNTHVRQRCNITSNFYRSVRRHIPEDGFLYTPSKQIAESALSLCSCSLTSFSGIKLYYTAPALGNRIGGGYRTDLENSGEGRGKNMDNEMRDKRRRKEAKGRKEEC